MRIMYDAVTPHNILNHTTTPQMVAGYANGRYQWSQTEWDLFPNAIKVRIAVRANYYDAHVLDCEEGDATPTQCPDWAWKRRQMGGTPIIYCNRSTWPLVRQAFDNRHMEQPLYWIATGSGHSEYPNGAIGAQYLLDWQGVDVSVMSDYIPGIDAQPFINGNESDDMVVIGKAFNPASGISQDYISVPCDGKRQLFISVGGTDIVEGIAYFVGNTPTGKDGQFMGKNITVHVDPNRPGPFSVPENCRVIILGITKATHDFTVWCA